jgi:molybdopterin/thiamine biosynthesis adenylyltransferase
VGRLGAAVSDMSEEEVLAHLTAACVHLSIEPDLPGALLALRLTLTTLCRMPGRVHLSPEGLEKRQLTEMIADATNIDSRRILEVGESVPDDAVHLHIGLVAPSSSAIRVVPDGYGVHIVREVSEEITQARSAHPLGSVVAAAFGVAEAFKDMAPVVGPRRVDHRHLMWCPVSLSEDLTAAPLIEGPMQLDLALAGCGAIGTAIALILSEVDASGTILVLDRQVLGPENIATYSLGGEKDALLRRRKVDLVAERLGGKYTVIPRHGDLETLAEDVDKGQIRWPRLVLAGLDSVAARHQVQLLWPDNLIDAATGGTAVGLHHIVAGSGPCLRCFFPSGGRVSAQEKLAEITDLPIELLGQGDEILLQEHIASLPAQNHERLAAHVGKKICNLASAMGLVEGAGAFQAAVTFVAMQAACLAVGRLLAVELGMKLPNFVQYDSLIGPRQDALEQRKPAPACYCQEKQERIRKIRARRLDVPPTHVVDTSHGTGGSDYSTRLAGGSRKLGG